MGRRKEDLKCQMRLKLCEMKDIGKKTPSPQNSLKLTDQTSLYSFLIQFSYYVKHVTLDSLPESTTCLGVFQMSGFSWSVVWS